MKLLRVIAAIAIAGVSPVQAASVSIIPSTDTMSTGVPASASTSGENICVDELAQSPTQLIRPAKAVHRTRRSPHRTPRAVVHRKRVVHRPRPPSVAAVVGEPRHVTHCVFLPPDQPAIEPFAVTFARAMSAVRPDNFDNWFQTVIRTRRHIPFVTGLSLIATATPEPSSWMLLIGGFLLVGIAVRRRRNHDMRRCVPTDS